MKYNYEEFLSAYRHFEGKATKIFELLKKEEFIGKGYYIDEVVFYDKYFTIYFNEVLSKPYKVITKMVSLPIDVLNIETTKIEAIPFFEIQELT